MIYDIKFTFDFFKKFEDLCLIISESGDIIDLNNSARNALAIKTQESKINFIKLLDPSCVDEFKKKTAKAVLEYSEQKITADIILDEGNFVFDLEIIPINEKDSKKESLIFILGKDITIKKVQERELLRFFSIAENTVNPLQITDINGRMIYVNPAFMHASGYQREELIGHNPSVFGSGKHSKKFWEKVWSTIKSGKVWVGEVENKRKSGEPFYTQLLISPILDSDGNVNSFFAIHRDLSDKRILEKQLIHTQKMESIGTLAAGIAHEVGNPLASISAIVQVILRTTDDEFVKEKLGLVKSQVTRISKIIRDLVDFSRPSNYELQVTDINKNLVEAVEITKVGTKTKNISFIVDLSNNIPLLPLISDQLQQIFVNILLNAVDAIIEKGNSNKENKINIKSYMDEDNVIIDFTDTGVGIPEANQTKIFEPFFTSKTEGKGTGLGLWVSYGIIKSFQGDIKVRSTKGEGTTFTVTIPIQS